MTGYRYPNESADYRKRRNELLEMEKDMVWLYWNLLDLTPEGRGEHPVPIQNFRHQFFSEHVL